MRTARYFSIIQLSNSRIQKNRIFHGYDFKSCPFFVIKPACIKTNTFLLFYRGGAIVLSLTVVGRKNRCIPCIYWATAIFAVVSDYSNLFLPLAFFLDRSHLTLSHELIVCPKTTGLMKVICDRLPFI